MTDLARRAFRRPVTAGEVRNTSAWSGRSGAGTFARGRARGRDPGTPGLPGFPVPDRDGPPGPPGKTTAPIRSSTNSRPGSRTSCGRACRTRRCDGQRMPARCAIPSCWPRRCGACCAIQGAPRWRRTSADSGCSSGHSSRPRAIAIAFRTSRTTCACRCGAKPNSSSTTSFATTAASSISSTADYSYLNERLARHYGVPDVSGPEFRRVDLSATPRGGVLDPGQRADRLVVCHPHLAGAARQVGARQPAQLAAAAAAARRPEPGRSGNRHGDVDARTARSASEGSDLRRRAIAAWIRSASASRTSTPSARGGPWTASSRSTRRARCRTANVHGPVELAAILTDQREAFARAITSKLMTYALGRGLERYDTRTVKLIASRLPRARLPVLRAGSGNRQQPALPVTKGRAHRSRHAMIVTRRHLPRRTFLKGMGAVIALPMLDAMTPAFARAADVARPARRGWRSPTCRTASR